MIVVAAIVVAFFFFISLFFSPIFSSIPPYATGAALVLIGVMLIAHVDHIQWDETKEAVPAFLTIIIMPFTLSVAYGVIAGILTYVALHLPEWMMHNIPKYYRKYISPSDEDGSDGTRALSASSVAKSHLRKRAVHRKVFGTSFRGSDDGSVMSFVNRPEEQIVDQSVASRPIPLGHSSGLSKSFGHAQYQAKSFSPIKSLFRTEQSSPRSDQQSAAGIVPRNSGSRVSPPERLGMLRSRTFADLASATQEMGKQVQEESNDEVKLFGDFQLLDLDLGDSGSSQSEEECIQLQQDGSLLLTLRSEGNDGSTADLTMFSSPPGYDEDLQKSILENQNVDKHEEEDVVAARVSLSEQIQAGSTENAASRLQRLGTSSSFQGTGQRNEEVQAVNQESVSQQQRRLSRVHSEAAVRLKNLFADVEMGSEIEPDQEQDS